MSLLFKEACGVIGIEPKYFLDELSPKGYQLIVDGYMERKKTEYEMIRSHAYITNPPHIYDKKGNIKRTLTIEEWWPFTWDKKQEEKELSYEERKKLFEQKIKNLKH